MTDDAQLLGRFLAGEEAAFGEIVRGHIDFVYRAALREVNGDAHLAKDVTQAVFLMLARKARELAEYRALTGWLYSTTRFCARAAIRKDRRWRNREKEAQAMTIEMKESVSDSDWKALGPVLDDALHELDAADREVVLLRYYENQPFAEVGARVGLAENSARMRVDRALEKLRLRLERRGVTSTAVALSAVLASQPAICAPTALAPLVIGASLAGVSAAGAVTASSAVIFMSTTKIVAAAAGLAAALAIGFYSGQQRAGPAVPGAEVEARLKDQLTRLRADNRDLSAEVERLRLASAGQAGAADRPADVLPPAASIPYAPGVPARLDAVPATTAATYSSIMNNLRQISAAADQFRLENKRDPESIDELVGAESTKYIKTLRVVDSESYANINLARNARMAVTTASGVEVDYGPGAQTKPPMPLATERAMTAFRAANNGRSPLGYELADYFDSPDFRSEYLDTAKVANLRVQLGAGFNQAAEKASKAWLDSYKAAYGTNPPMVFQAYEQIASYFENDQDRAHYVETLRKVAAQAGQHSDARSR